MDNKIKRVKLNDVIYNIDSLISLIDESLESSDTIQGILDTLDATNQTILIFKNSLEAPTTPQNKVYPPQGWTKKPTPLSSGQVRYICIGQLHNNEIIEWDKGARNYWSIPIAITGNGGSSESENEIIYSAYKVGTDETILQNFNRDQRSNPPYGFSNNANLIPGEGEYIYITTAKKLGNVWETWTSGEDSGHIWSTPVKLGNSNTSESGSDINGYNYVYLRTVKETDMPAVPNFKVEDIENAQAGLNCKGEPSDKATNTWYDHPNGVQEDIPFEWVAISRPDDDNKYTHVALWSSYGKAGRDGDGFEYIYTRVSKGQDVPTLTPPYTGNVVGQSTVSGVIVDSDTYQQDDFIPFGWSDNPVGTTSAQPDQYVSIRKKQWVAQESESKWGAFSTPTLWSNYTELGELSVESSITRYRKGNDESEFVTNQSWRTVKALDDNWQASQTFQLEEGEFVWMTTASTINGEVTGYSDGGVTYYWSTPICVGGGSTSSIVQDNEFFNYVFYRTNEADKSKILQPSATQTPEDFETVSAENEDYGYLPNGNKITDISLEAWRDHPLGVSESARFEYMCVYDYKKEAWDKVTLWSSFGVNGADGDSVEYVYTSTQTEKPAPTEASLYVKNGTYYYDRQEDTEYQKDDFIGDIWRDEPIGVSEDTPFEWVSIRHKKGGSWGPFNKPAIWSHYGKDGEAGVVEGYILACDNDNVVIDDNLFQLSDTDSETFNQLAQATFTLSKIGEESIEGVTFQIVQSESTSYSKFNPSINNNGQLTYNVAESDQILNAGDTYSTKINALVDGKVVASRRQIIYVADFSNGESYKLNVQPNAIKLTEDGYFNGVTKLDVGVLCIGKEVTDISNTVSINSKGANSNLYYKIEKNGDDNDIVSTTTLGDGSTALENIPEYYVVNLYCVVGDTPIKVDSETVNLYKDGKSADSSYIISLTNDNAVIDDTVGTNTHLNVKTATKTSISLYCGASEESLAGWELNYDASDYDLPTGMSPVVDNNTNQAWVEVTSLTEYQDEDYLESRNYYYIITAYNESLDLEIRKKFNLIVSDISSTGSTYKLTITNDTWAYSGEPNSRGQYPILSSSYGNSAMYVTEIVDGKATLIDFDISLVSKPTQEKPYVIIPSSLSSSVRKVTGSKYYQIVPYAYYSGNYSFDLFTKGTLLDSETIQCVKNGKDGISQDPLYSMSLDNDNVIIDDQLIEEDITTISQCSVTVNKGNTVLESSKYTVTCEIVQEDEVFTYQKNTNGVYSLKFSDSYDSSQPTVPEGVYLVKFTATLVENSSIVVSKIQTVTVSDVSNGVGYKLIAKPNSINFEYDDTGNLVTSINRVQLNVIATEKGLSKSVNEDIIIGVTSIGDLTIKTNHDDIYTIMSSGENDLYLDDLVYDVEPCVVDLYVKTNQGDVLLDSETINFTKNGINGSGANQQGYVLEASPSPLVKEKKSESGGTTTDSNEPSLLAEGIGTSTGTSSGTGVSGSLSGNSDSMLAVLGSDYTVPTLHIRAYKFNGTTQTTEGLTVRLQNSVSTKKSLSSDQKCYYTSDEILNLPVSSILGQTKNVITVDLYDEDTKVKTIYIQIVNPVQGVNGAVLRYRGIWSDITKQADEDLEFFGGDITDADDIRYIDVVKYNDSYYQCNTTYLYSDHNKVPSNSNYWKVATQFDFLVTDTLISNYIKTNTITSNEVLITEEEGTKIVAGMSSAPNYHNEDQSKPTDNDIRIWAGNSYGSDGKFDVNNAPFKVTNAGKLYAENAEISGDICAQHLVAENFEATSQDSSLSIKIESNEFQFLVGGQKVACFRVITEDTTIQDNVISKNNVVLDMLINNQWKTLNFSSGNTFLNREVSKALVLKKVNSSTQVREIPHLNDVIIQETGDGSNKIYNDNGKTTVTEGLYAECPSEQEVFVFKDGYFVSVPFTTVNIYYIASASKTLKKSFYLVHQYTISNDKVNALDSYGWYTYTKYSSTGIPKGAVIYTGSGKQSYNYDISAPYITYSTLVEAFTTTLGSIVEI